MILKISISVALNSVSLSSVSNLNGKRRTKCLNTRFSLFGFYSLACIERIFKWSWFLNAFCPYYFRNGAENDARTVDVLEKTGQEKVGIMLLIITNFNSPLSNNP